MANENHFREVTKMTRLIDVNEYQKTIQSAMDKYDGYDTLQNRIIQGLMEADALLD